MAKNKTYRPYIPEAKGVESSVTTELKNDNKKKKSYRPVIPEYEAQPHTVYAGNVPTGISGIPLGQSQYDEGMPLGGLQNVEAYRAGQQSTGEALVNGLASRAISIVPKFLGQFGFLAAAPAALIKKDFDVMVDNPFSEAMHEFDQSLRQWAPVYASLGYQEGNILDRMGSTKFWFDDTFDGAAFMISAMAPVGIVGKAGKALGAIGKGTKAMNVASKLGKTGKVLRNMNKAFKESGAYKFAQKELGGGKGVVTIWNTIGEAGMEAADTKRSVLEKLRPKVEAGEMTQEEANLRASNAAKYDFNTNFGILLGPNFIQSTMMMGGFKFSKDISKKALKEAIDAGESLSKITGKVITAVGKGAALGIVSEGLWEEGMQNAVQNYETKRATGDYDKNRVLGYVNEWTKGFSDVEAQSAMIIGAIMGSTMGGISSYMAKKGEQKGLDVFKENYNKYKADDLVKIKGDFTDRYEKVVNDDGTVSPEGVAKAFYRQMNDKKLYDESVAASVNGDKFRYEYNRKMAAARYAWQFLHDNKNMFDGTEDALDFALQQFDDAFDVEKFGEEERSTIKNYIEDAAKAYEAADEQSIKAFAEAKNMDEIDFANTVKKALYYEDMKRRTLDSFKADLPTEQIDEVDKLIEDSQSKTNQLLNSKERKLLRDDYLSIQEAGVKLRTDLRRIEEIYDTLEKGKDKNGKTLVSADRAKLEKELEDLEYLTEEGFMIEGEERIDPLEIVKDPKELEAMGMGLRDEAYFHIGQAYKKKAERERLMRLYNGEKPVPGDIKSPETVPTAESIPTIMENENVQEIAPESSTEVFEKPTAEDVVNSIIEHTNEEYSPYTQEDKETLESLQKDLREKRDSINVDWINAMEEDMEALVATGMDIEEVKAIIGQETYDKLQEQKKILKDVNRALPKIEQLLGSETFNDLDKNALDSARQEVLQYKAAQRMLDRHVDPVLEAFNSNPEGYSNVDEIQRALKALRVMEKGYARDDHTDMRRYDAEEMNHELFKRIELLSSELNIALDKAVKNKSDKLASDIKSSVEYGKMRARVFDNEILRNTIFDSVEEARNLIDEMKKNDMNYIYIENIVSKIKDLEEGERKVILTALKDQRDKAIDNIIEKMFEMEKANTEEKVRNKVLTEDQGKESIRVTRKRLNDLKSKYKDNPSAIFQSTVRSFLVYKKESSAITPFDIYVKNGNISELNSGLESLNEGDPMNIIFGSLEDAKELVSLHMSIESADNMITSITSDIDTYKLLEAELKDYQANKSSGTEIAPSRQQRISIFELVRWFKNKYAKEDEYASNGYAAMAYLKGLAGTGKTTVVGRLFFKLAGIDLNNVMVTANNESATKTINESIGTTNTKSVDNITEEDLAGKELLIIDEVGALDRERLKNITDLVGVVNTKRKEAGEPLLKVLTMGDPSQIRPAGEVTAPIEIIENVGRIGDLVTHISPLTIPFRSNVNSVVEFQDVFHLNGNFVSGITVKASNPIGEVSDGVHVGQTRNQLIDQVRVAKDSNRTKVIIVEDESDIAFYKDKLSDLLDIEVLDEKNNPIGKALEILTYRDVQGRTFEEVYIDLPLEKYAVNDEMQEATIVQNNFERNTILYTATSRAKDYVFYLDNTGMKNSIDSTIEDSKKESQSRLEDYKKQYLRDVTNDKRIMKDESPLEDEDVDDESDENPVEEEKIREEKLDEEKMYEKEYQEILDEVDKRFEHEDKDDSIIINDITEGKGEKRRKLSGEEKSAVVLRIKNIIKDAIKNGYSDTEFKSRIEQEAFDFSDKNGVLKNGTKLVVDFYNELNKKIDDLNKKYESLWMKLNQKIIDSKLKETLKGIYKDLYNALNKTGKDLIDRMIIIGENVDVLRMKIRELAKETPEGRRILEEEEDRNAPDDITEEWKDAQDEIDESEAITNGIGVAWTPEDQMKEILDSYESSKTPGVHNVIHTKNMWVEDPDNPIKVKMPYDKGDDVIYVAVKKKDSKDPSKETMYIAAYVIDKNNKDYYYEAGMLTDSETLELFGATTEELTANRNRGDQFTRPLVGHGKFARPISEEAIVGRGVVSGIPIPLTYVFSKDTTMSGNGFVERAANKVVSLFTSNGFEHVSTDVKIYTPNVVKRNKLKGIRPGHPYIVMEFKSKDGKKILQHIKLTAKKINRETDSNVITPIESFISSIKDIENVLSNHGLQGKLGSSSFNSLIKLFKNNYRINSDGNAVIKKNKDVVTLSDAKRYLPKITREEFNKVSDLMTPVINGIYGKGNVLVEMSEKSFKEYMNKIGAEAVDPAIFGEGWFVDRENDIYYKLTKGGHIEKRVIVQDKKTKEDKLVYQKINGKEEKHLMEDGLVAGKGYTQIALNSIAANNDSPNGVKLRVHKTINNISQITAKSLLSSEDSLSDYGLALLAEVKAKGLPINKGLDINTIETITVMEEQLKQVGFTQNDLNNMKNDYVSKPLTSDDLTKILDIDEATGESRSVYKNLSIKEFNDKEKNLQERIELAEDQTVTHFKEIYPTRIQIKVTEYKKPQTTERPKIAKPQKPERKKSAFSKLDERRRRRGGRAFVLEEGKEGMLGEKVSQKKALGIIQRMTNMGDMKIGENVKFVENFDNLATSVPKNAIGMFFDGIIYLKKNDDGTVYKNVAKHEAFHYVWENMLDTNQKKRLRIAFEEENPEVKSMSDPTEFEEFVAEKYQVWNKGDYLPRNKFIRAVFKVLRAFISYIADNRLYIESIFRDINDGKPRRYSPYSTKGANAALRKAFNEPNMLKDAMIEIDDVVNELNQNGYKGYPVPSNEIREYTFKVLVDEAKERYGIDAKVRIVNGKYKIERIDIEDSYTLKNLLNEYEVLRKQDSTPERNERLAELREEIGEIKYQLKLDGLRLEYFNDLFKLMFPSYSHESLMTVKDIFTLEEEDEIADIGDNVNINDDIVDWTKVDMEAKITSEAKQFLSNIPYNKEFIPLRFAYKIALTQLDNIRESGIDMPIYLQRKIEEETDGRVKAVLTAISNLYDNTKDFAYVVLDMDGEQDLRGYGDPTGVFISPGEFVYSLNNSNLSKYKSELALNLNSENYEKITRGKKESMEQFINRIEEETSKNGFDNFNKETLFINYKMYQQGQLINTLMVNFLSQRTQFIKHVESEGPTNAKSFDYISASKEDIARTNRGSISDAILGLTDSDISDITTKFKKYYGKKLSYNEKKELIKDFFKTLGLSHLGMEMRFASNNAINEAFNSLEFVFVKGNLLKQLNKEAAKRIKEDELKESKKNKDNNVDSDVADLDTETNINENALKTLKVNDKVNSLIRNLTSVIDRNPKVDKATSVRDLDGKKKYIHVLSGGAHLILNTIKEHFGKKKLMPEFTGNDYFSKNSFINGLNKIIEVEDFDGTVYKKWNGDQIITTYGDETFSSYHERSFSAQFLNQLTKSSKDEPQYSQNLFTISNKPNNISAKIKAFKPEEVKEALANSVEQIANQEDFSDTIVNGSNLRIVSNNAVAEAIEEVIPGSVQPIFDSKTGEFSHYELKKAIPKQLLKNKQKIAEAAYNIITDVYAKETLRLFKLGNINFVTEDFTHENVTSLVDKNKYKDYKPSKLNKKLIYNWKTKKVEETKDWNDTVQYYESYEDVLNRVNRYFNEETGGKHTDFISYDDMVKALRNTEHSEMIQVQQLIKDEDILPVIAAYQANDYINSRALTELIAGELRFYNNDNDLNKRLSGATAPGLRPFVDDHYGIPRYSRVAIIEDAKYKVGENIYETLKTGFGLSDVEIAKLVPMFGGIEKVIEYTDAQGFMLPERYEEIVSGMGEKYGAGAVMKPAYFNIDEDGPTRMLKYSSIVLTDELIEAIPALGVLRDKMRRESREESIMEVVFKSGNKVGTPKDLGNTQNILSDPNAEIDFEKNGFLIDNINYRLQLNPLHDIDSTVANPTQLGYFLNTDKKNLIYAKRLYSAIADIIDNNREENISKLNNLKDLKSYIRDGLRASERDRKNLDLFNQLANDGEIKRPWNYPGFTDSISRQLIATINKNVVKVRYKGSKFVLQTAWGTDTIKNLSEEDKAKALDLQYKVREGGTAKKIEDILYAEVMLPKGTLPPEIEQAIEEGDENASVRYIHGDLLGFRIPSSELHSAVPLKVVGFYPEGTNVIIAPKEIVSFHGSDYDVDALFVIRREYPRDEGKLIDKPYGYKWDAERGLWIFDHNYRNTDEFKNSSKEIQNKHHRNSALEAFLEAISIRQNRYRMAKPISLVELKKDIERLIKLKYKNKRIYQDSSNVIHRQKVHASAFESVSGTGIFANAIKVLAYVQRTGEEGQNPSLIMNVEDKEGNIKEDKRFVFTAIDEDGNVQEYAIMVNDESLWEDLDALLNSAIDNIKEQDLAKLNLTSNNIKAYIAMRAFGVGGKGNEMKTVNNLFAQSFVEAINILGSNGNKVLNTFFNNVRDKYGITLNNSNTIDNNELEETLSSEFEFIELMNDFKEGKELSAEALSFIQKQYKAYNAYNLAMKIGGELSDMSKYLKIIKELPTDVNELEEILEIRDHFLSGKSIMNIQHIEDNLPHLRSIAKTAEDVVRTNKERFYRSNSILHDKVKSIMRINRFKVSEKDRENRQAVVDEFIKYAINGAKFDKGKYPGFEYETSRKLKNGTEVYAEEAFIERAIENVRLLKASNVMLGEGYPVKSNMFISALVIEKLANGKSRITFDGGNNLDYADVIDFENSFKELSRLKIKDGKVELLKPEEEPDVESNSMGYSKLQKDFMRYLMVSNGIIYSKQSYEDVMPLRMRALFHREFEKTMDEILSNEELLDAHMENFALLYSLKHPEGLQYISSENKNSDEKKNKYEKYIYEKDGKYADFTVKIKYNDKGELNVGKMNREYPLIVRGWTTDRKDGSKKAIIYYRVDPIPDGVENTNDIIRYQAVGFSQTDTVYPFRKTLNNSIIPLSKSMDSIVPNVRVKSVDNQEIETLKKFPKGKIITITAYSDPSRQQTKYVKITNIKEEKIDLKEDGKIVEGTKYIYTVVNAKKEDVIVKDTSKEPKIKANQLNPTEIKVDFLNSSAEAISKEIKSFNNSRKEDEPKIMSSYLELEKVSKESNNKDYKRLASYLLEDKSIKNNIIYRGRLDEDTSGIYVIVFDPKINKFRSVTIARNDLTGEKFQKTLLHEEIHRYTSTLLANWYMSGFSESKMKDMRFSENEILFAKRITSLYSIYKKKNFGDIAFAERVLENVRAKTPYNELSEFLTYGLTDPEFSEKLKNITFDGKESIFSKLVSYIANLFGVNKDSIYNILDESLKVFMLEEDNFSKMIASESIKNSDLEKLLGLGWVPESRVKELLGEDESNNKIDQMVNAQKIKIDGTKSNVLVEKELSDLKEEINSDIENVDDNSLMKESIDNANEIIDSKLESTNPADFGTVIPENSNNNYEEEDALQNILKCGG